MNKFKGFVLALVLAFGVPILVSAQETPREGRDNAATTTDRGDRNDRDWGWVGLLGLAGLLGLKRREHYGDVHDHDRDRVTVGTTPR
jgi:MYXO-CTERM domain-containing protein